MKFFLILLILFSYTAAFSQTPEISLNFDKQDTSQKVIPIRFNQKLYGFITGISIDHTGSYGQDEDSKLYKSTNTIFNIRLFRPLNAQQQTWLEDSLKHGVIKKNKDTYVYFNYTKDYYDASVSKNPQNETYDPNTAGMYLRQSGKLRNALLTVGIAGAVVSGGIIILGSPIAGEIIAGVCAIVIIVEEYRANNLLIKAGDKLLMM